MSNLLYMDESNGNGVYATKLNINSTNTNATTTATMAAPAAGTTTATGTGMGMGTATATTNNLNNIMNATATTANAVITTVASTVGNSTTLPTSVSNEDLSQSLSEYTDADESISAPTEFLAEFLSAVMLKDYKKALKYCKLILQYEPNNSTAKEFYPLILDKLRGAASSDSDENYNKSSSPELVLDLQCSDPSAGESDEAGSDEPQLGMSVDDDYGAPDDNFSGGHDSHSNSTSSSNNCSEGLSLSESVDSENDDDDDDDDEDDDDDDDVDVEEEEEEEDVMSSSGDDLPVDEPEQDNAPVEHIVSNLDGSGSHSSRNSSSGGGGRSRSDNTTHSYSSLLLEEEDDLGPANLPYTRNVTAADLDVSNGNKLPSASCSDSESPTEPLTQRLAAILRSKCGVSSAPDDNY